MTLAQKAKFGVLFAAVFLMHAVVLVLIGQSAPSGPAFPWWLIVVEPVAAFVVAVGGQMLVEWVLE